MQTVREDLILFNVEAADAEEAIRKVGQRLLEKQFVKDSYIDAVVEREAVYPTGLQLRGMAVAMPHTAGIHVNTPAVCLAKLAHPVTFSHMGDPDVKVEAELLFMMAIQDPDAQLEMLQQVMGVFVNEEAVMALKNADSEASLYEIAKTYIG